MNKQSIRVCVHNESHASWELTRGGERIAFGRVNSNGRVVFDGAQDPAVCDLVPSMVTSAMMASCGEGSIVDREFFLTTEAHPIEDAVPG